MSFAFPDLRDLGLTGDSQILSEEGDDELVARLGRETSIIDSKRG